MTEPTVSPTATIILDGEARTLKYGFRAYKALGINPFDPESVAAFRANKLSLDVAAAMIRAGLLHEYAKNGPRHGQEPPTVDEIIDLLDFVQFAAMFADVQRAMGTDEPTTEPSPETPANPPAA